MRNYNFPVSFAATSGTRLCRVILNERFSPRELVGDFPKTITSRYLNDVVGRGMTIATYEEAPGNAIDIIISPNAKIDDVDRAIVLNLLDFGQDFEAERSTTIDAAIFFVENPTDASIDLLLEALESALTEAAAFMTERLAEFPPDDEFLAESWPQDWVDEQTYDWPGYHFFNFVMYYAQPFSRDERTFVHEFMNASHDINMWNGYNPGISAAQSVESGRSGTSFEIDVAESTVTYVIERTPCDPALSVKRFAEVMYERKGTWPERWDIGVEPED